MTFNVFREFPARSAERAPLHVIPSSTASMSSCCELTGAEKQLCVLFHPPIVCSHRPVCRLLPLAFSLDLTRVRGGGNESGLFVARRDTEPAMTAARFVLLATWIGSRLPLPATLTLLPVGHITTIHPPLTFIYEVYAGPDSTTLLPLTCTIA